MEELILLEDEHLLAVRKPSGINTHAAGPFAGEGIYEWLRRREPRWADLAIIQRLDKETSGVLLFSKSRRANVSLTKQFSRRRVSKVYELLTDRRPPERELTVRSRIRKGYGRFESLVDGVADDSEEGLEAETHFTVLEEAGESGRWRVRAEPRTGRTHQIRIHAADSGFPILGDALYGGTPHGRLCLHACALTLRHPATNEEMRLESPADFGRQTGLALRAAVVDPVLTDAFRVVHGAADGHPGWYVERLGEFLLASTAEAVGDGVIPEWLRGLAAGSGAKGLAIRRLERHVRGASPESVGPRHVWGEPPPEEFAVRENGVRFLLRFGEGYSCGLFLDQRDNRRRLLRNWVGPAFPVCEGDAGLAGAEVLNVFAYTCGFSVAAAGAGARVTSLDLSRKYLDWGRRNFEANGLDPAAHDFIFGDALDWMKRLGKKGRRFKAVLLDPPTFSQSRESGVFRAENDYGGLVSSAARLLDDNGVLIASTNAARLEPGAFLDQVHQGLEAAGCDVAAELFIPQPPDFPTCREEPGYLKTLWVRVRRA